MLPYIKNNCLYHHYYSLALLYSTITSCVASKLCDSLNCEFKCRASLEGGVCYCDTGKTINPVDKRTCIDLNECNDWGYCDQVCINTEGSYKCSCAPGYSLVPPRHCKANNSKLFFLQLLISPPPPPSPPFNYFFSSSPFFMFLPFSKNSPKRQSLSLSLSFSFT